MSAAGEGRLAFSPAEAADALGVSLTLVKDLLRSGDLRSRKVGRRRIISRQALDQFLDAEQS